MQDEDKTKEQLINELAELRQRVDELKRLKTHYKNLLANIPQKVFYKDKGSIYVRVNPSYAKDFDISPESFIGKTDYDFFPKELAEKYRADDQHIMQSGTTVDFDESYLHKGEEKTVHTLKTPVRDDIGNIIGVLGIFWDITERKLAEKHREELITELKDALSQVRQLSGMLPICASCKKIRDDKGYWNQIEKYLTERTEALFTHGLCPDCAKKAYEELEQFNKKSSMM
ncbi:MAG TPA: PAS domain-containing protein [Thermodesulfovibrionales bacterium]|nr:PAS domain-containing protein [Thermodesulfovibrionales bacterium]